MRSAKHVMGLIFIMPRTLAIARVSCTVLQPYTRTKPFLGRRTYIPHLDPHQWAPPRPRLGGAAKGPGRPRAYLFGARAASAVRTLSGPALAEVRILSAIPRLP